MDMWAPNRGIMRPRQPGATLPVILQNSPPQRRPSRLLTARAKVTACQRHTTPTTPAAVCTSGSFVRADQSMRPASPAEPYPPPIQDAVAIAATATAVYPIQ